MSCGTFLFSVGGFQQSGTRNRRPDRAAIFQRETPHRVGRLQNEHLLAGDHGDDRIGSGLDELDQVGIEDHFGVVEPRYFNQPMSPGGPASHTPSAGRP
jgi:hypothetical protein